MSTPKKITFEQLCYLSKVVDLFDADGHKFEPFTEVGDDIYGHATYTPGDEGSITFYKPDSEKDELVIYLHEDRVVIPEADPVGEGDLELFLKFGAEYMTGHDPSTKLPPNTYVHARWDLENVAEGRAVVELDAGVWTTKAGRGMSPPVRWYPIWDIVLAKALRGEVPA